MEPSDSNRRRSTGLKFGSALSGLILALGFFTIYVASVFFMLVAAGMDPHSVRSGDFSMFVTIAVTFSAVAALFVGFYWGGSVAARLSGGGIGHGLLTSLLTFPALAIAWGLLILVRIPEKYGLPAGIGALSDRIKPGGFTSVLEISGFLAFAAILFGGTLGGIFGKRKRITMLEDQIDEAPFDFSGTGKLKDAAPATSGSESSDPGDTGNNRVGS